ncbi:MULTISPECIES: HNH endonuclease family protein [unclassified Rathayibacter]|uniref:HNH endonuclease family protein n=1 Tax=unclassified Rathayibacter TaxID=2609250 RepID=UPI0012E877E4|nr:MULTISPECIES: HNH endonuclease family protein [unclassified Rathayibacter]
MGETVGAPGAIGTTSASPSAAVASAPASPVASPAVSPTATTAASPSTAAVGPAAEALAALAAIPTVDGFADLPYDRDLFGQAWSDVDRNGCDTRNDILGRDLMDPVFKPGTRDCKVLAGLLIDPYDGTAVSFVSGSNTSRLVQIDHVVALGWAWHHGAWAWSDEQRLAFANDPANLVAASEETNQAKSDAGPGEWLPPARELQCGYIEQFVAVVSAYGLEVTELDRKAAKAVLANC